MTKYVIIGGSVGGIGALEAIRELDPIGTITVISEETFPQYSRPMITDRLSDTAAFQQMKYRDDLFWEQNQVQLFNEHKAVALNLTAQQVTLDDGTQIKYEKLLLATGGKPFVPQVEGKDKHGVFTFTTMADATSIQAHIKPDTRVVVIGGGLIGVSAAEALVKQGLPVTLVELKDRILNLILDSTASKIIEQAIQTAGVTLVTGQTVKQICGKQNDHETVGGVILTNGDEIPCDLVIFAIGVIPRTELVANTDVKINRGILVDQFMGTTVPTIYACGDAAEVHDFIWKKHRLLLNWPTAYLGGRTAGYNMAGQKTEYPGGTTMSALKYFKTPIISIGLVNPTEDDGYEILTRHEPQHALYKKLVLKEETLVGILAVTEIEGTGILFYLMKNHVKVGSFKQKLLSPDFGLIHLPEPLKQRMLLGNLA